MHKTKPGSYEPFIPRSEFNKLSQAEKDAQVARRDAYWEDQEIAAGISGFQHPDPPSTREPVPTPNYTDDEKTVIMVAILDAKFNLKEAYRLIALDTNMLSKDLILRWDKLKNDPVSTLAGIYDRNTEHMWKILHSRVGLRRAAEIMEEGGERVAAELIKHASERALGKPTQNIRAEVVTLSWSDIERRRQEGIKIAEGEWTNTVEERSTNVGD